MATLDLLGRRWTLRFLWELAREPEAPTFRELQQRCGAMSSSVLANRLSELREAQIVTNADRGRYGDDPITHQRPRTPTAPTTP